MLKWKLIEKYLQCAVQCKYHYSRFGVYLFKICMHLKTVKMGSFDQTLRIPRSKSMKLAYLLSEAETPNSFEKSHLWISGLDKREKMAGYSWLEQLWRAPWRTPFWTVINSPFVYSSIRRGPPESPRHVPSELALRLPEMKKVISTFARMERLPKKQFWTWAWNSKILWPL